MLRILARALLRNIAVSSYRVMDIAVLDLIDAERQGERREQVARALGDLRRYEPRMLQWMRDHDVPIVLVPVRGSAVFTSISGAIHLPADHLTSTYSFNVLAGIILHEATHARIHARGIRPTAGRHDRIERVCLDAERRFLASLVAAGYPHGAWYRDVIERRAAHVSVESTRTLRASVLHQGGIPWPIARRLTAVVDASYRLWWQVTGRP